MNQHLVPTPIVNKNGVSTTVYKSVETPRPSTTWKIPAPSGVTTTIPVSAQIMRAVRNTLEDPFLTTPSAITTAKIERALEGYPHETQEYINEILKRNDDDTYLDRMIISMLDKRYSPETIEDALFVYDALPDSWDEMTYDNDWTEDGFDVDHRLIRMINGARSYGVEVYRYGTDDISLRNHDEDTQKQALALIAFAYEMYGHDDLRPGLSSDDTSMYISDTSTVQALVREPSRMEEIRDTMLAYGRLSLGAAEEVKNAPSVPLRDGTL